MRTMLPVLALALAGCADDEGEVYLLYVPQSQSVECETSITENFTEGNVAEDEGEGSDWTYTRDFESSDELIYASIADGRKGAAYLTIYGEVIPGTRKGKTYTFTWTDKRNVEEINEFGPSEYRYVESDIEEETVELTFERDKETGGLTGHMKVVNVYETIATETDEWDRDEYNELPSSGEINQYSYWLLTGSGVTNEYDTSDCDDAECNITIQESCSGQFPVRAEWVGYSDAALPGLMGYF